MLSNISGSTYQFTTGQSSQLPYDFHDFGKVKPSTNYAQLEPNRGKEIMINLKY